jgi:hypothetical protein
MTSLSSFDLESLSSQKLTYLYLDSSGDLQVDQDHSFFGILTRFVLSIFGQRDYNLCHILPIARQQLSEKNVQFLNIKLAKKAGLNTQELENIQKLSTYYFNPSCSYSSEEIQALKTFIEGACESERLSRAINQLQAMEVTLENVHEKALQTLKILTSQTKKAKKLKKAFKKVEDLAGKLKKDGTLSEPMKKKISLKEMRVLESVSQLAPVFRDFGKMGIKFDKTSKFGMMRRNINRTENIINRLHNLIDRQQPLAPINFIFYDLPNFISTKPSHLHPIVPLIFRYFRKTDISHVSFSYRNQNNKEMENHILGEMIQTQRTLSSYPYKTFVPDMDKLFFNYPEQLQTKLCDFYGPKWKEILGKKYHQILIELFKNPTYEDLPSSAINKFIATLGLGCVLSEGPLKKKLRFSEYKGCICAEFVMKSLRQAYTKLEKQVQRDWKLRMQRQNVELEVPKLPNFLSEEQIAASLTPAGIARVLRDGGLVREKERPKILSQILDYQEYDMERALDLSLPEKSGSKG